MPVSDMQVTEHLDDVKTAVQPQPCRAPPPAGMGPLERFLAYCPSTPDPGIQRVLSAEAQANLASQLRAVSLAAILTVRRLGEGVPFEIV